MIRILFIIMAFFAFSPAVYAETTVTEQILQKGVFLVTGCDDGRPCLCEADIKYPLISGLKDGAAQTSINAGIRKNAEQVKCEGEPSKETSKENSFTITYSYQIPFQSPQIISFLFNEWAFEGGAHGNGIIDGMIIDLETGKILTVKELFDDKKLGEVNQLIYNTLIPDAQDIFRDGIEKRKTSFIQDGKCNGCIVTLGKDGIHVAFQTYEVAPFSSGNPTVTIPFTYSSYPAIAAILAEIPKDKSDK